MTLDWRTDILTAFTPGVQRKTVVLDTDALFREEQLFLELTRRGFSVIHFTDPIEFRFTYESEFRADWDAGGNRELVVVLGPGNDDFAVLPADVLADAPQLSFHLQDVFPQLSYNVVSQLDRIYFDQLYAAQQQYAEQSLGDAHTKDFVLRHVFEIAPELIKQDSDLLRVLLQRHYRRQNIPELLDEYLTDIVKKADRFTDWPLKTILRDREAFWEFLQERWPRFVQKLTGSQTGEVPELGEAQAMRFPSAPLLPFDHDDVRVYIDNLFAEGLLRPIDWVAEAVKAVPWVRVGMTGSSNAAVRERFDELCRGVADTAPSSESSAGDWLAFAPKYARMKAVRTGDSEDLTDKQLSHCDGLSARLNTTFSEWTHQGYAGLFNYPPLSPVMVHHIPAFLAHRLEREKATRIAFLLIDGLALDQWEILKEIVTPQLPNIAFEDRTLMAWIPSTTPVSRQAAYSGKVPGYFAATIDRTDKDETAWRRFWSDRGMAPDQVAFTAVPGNPGDQDKIDKALSHKTRVLGATVFKVDKIMHGAELGAVGMAGQVRTWAQESFLCGTIQDLLERGFEIWLSADHGNTESKGIGVPKEGVLSETRGERCRVYTSESLRDNAAGSFPDAIPWDHSALPKDYHCLLAPPERAFAHTGETVICHGGNSLDEVVVPFVRIARKGERY